MYDVRTAQTIANERLVRSHLAQHAREGGDEQQHAKDGKASDRQDWYEVGIHNLLR
jgi:hypothetical protein